MTCVALAQQARGLEVTFNTATEVPVTAASYNATGVINFTLDFAPTPGTNLTVIKNTGLPFINGKFSNLANGATVNLTHNGTTYPFVAWYYGGEGNNDLVLLWPYTGLAAWGRNDYGQLGDNSQTQRQVPVAVEQTGVLVGKTIVQVARGGFHSLALCSDGTVAAWGRNDDGQIGDNSTTNRPVPVAVNAASGTSALANKTVVAVAAGEGHSVALCRDGTVAAWGRNSYNQLGDNSAPERLVPVAVNTAAGTSALAGKSVSSIAAGGHHCLALCTDGTVVAWGRNGDGQLGDNNPGHRLAPVAVLTTGTALAGKTVVAIAAGDLYSVALCSDGTVASWGRNDFGALGTGVSGSQSAPVAVNTGETSALNGRTVVAIAAGKSHNLALCSDGTVAAWGWNVTGQLGDTSVTTRNVPVVVTMVETSALAGKAVVSIHAGSLHSLALCSDGTVAAWGWNSLGQIGDNATLNRTVPVAVNVEAGTSALASRRVSGLSVSSMADHSMAIYGLVTAIVPEIRVTGNGLEIPHGDTTPNASDLTDFGSANLFNAKVSRTFTITNDGNAPLSLSGTPPVYINGPDADSFGLSLEPAATVPPGSSTQFTITFDPRLPGLNTATVMIASNAANHPGFSFDIRGFGKLDKARAQTLTFAPPATVYLDQSPLSLGAFASSGLPVTLTVVPAGTTAAGASIAGNVLSFTGTGTVKVQAVQAGDATYAAAAAAVKTITVKTSPPALTLLNLAQTYTGTPRVISTTGGTGAVTIEYKIGPAFGSAAPMNAGSYPVRATDSKGTKTGTLVIAKAPLYVTPNDTSKFVGQDNPPLTQSYSGWVNGETAGLLTAAPFLKTTATKTSVGGLYPITANGGVAPANYAFIYQQGTLVVNSFAASYEALLDNNSGVLVGKVTITVVAANTSFSGKLYCVDEKAALTLKGTLATHPETESASGNAPVTSGGIPYVVNVTTQFDGTLTASVTRGGNAYSSGTGHRLLTLATGKTATFNGAHTAVLEPATPAGNNVPVGAGWASALISSKGEMTLAGKLGDGISFTTTVPADNADEPVFRLFVQPYKTGSAVRTQSCLGGAFALLPHPSSAPALAGRRYVESAGLTWFKAGLGTDDTYRAGFGPVSTVLMLDPWLPPAAAKGSVPAIPLAARLGLTNNSFAVQHSPTGSTLNGELPTRTGLSSTNTVTTPAANTTKWKTTLVPATGLFTGSFELADTTPKPRIVNFTGVMRQPATAQDTLIGDGHYLLPPLTGTEKTTGEIMFVRP